MNQNASSDTGMWQTIWKALTLNSQLYQVSQSKARTYRATVTIVLLAALSRALGSAIISLLNRVTPPVFFATLLLGILSDILGYYFWAFTIWKVGQWFRFNPPTYRELLYPIGFAYSPQVLNIITIIPLLGRPIELLLAAWTLLAVTVAVRGAMSVTLLRAALLCLISFPLIQIVPIVLQVVAQQFAN